MHCSGSISCIAVGLARFRPACRKLKAYFAAKATRNSGSSRAATSDASTVHADADADADEDADLGMEAMGEFGGDRAEAAAEGASFGREEEKEGGEDDYDVRVARLD